MLKYAGLLKLVEECGELAQIASKKIAYMDTDDHPDGKGSMKARLEEEIADVLASMEHVVTALGLDEDTIEKRFNRKCDLFDAWAKEGNTP